MAQLTCEMCNSTDFLKSDGVFVCQQCGCKYSVEEARKMMFGDGAPSAPAAPAASAASAAEQKNKKLENLRTLAERAKEDDDSENAAKYYEQILIEDPNDWAANFYSVYYAAHNIKIAQIGSAANRVANCIESVFKLIKNNVEEPAKQAVACLEVATKVISFSNMLFNNISSHLGSNMEIARKNTDNWAYPTVSMLVITADKMLSVFDDETVKSINEPAAMLVYKTAKQYSDVCKDVTTKMRQLDGIVAGRISSLEKQQKAREKAEAEKRRREYWAEHAEEKAALEAEKESLQEQVDALGSEYKRKQNALNKELNNVPGYDEIKSMTDRITKLTAEKNSLGLFKGKQKKELQAQIDQLTIDKQNRISKMESDKKAIQSQIDQLKTEHEKKLAPLKSRIDQIKTELTKDR